MDLGPRSLDSPLLISAPRSVEIDFAMTSENGQTGRSARVRTSGVNLDAGTCYEALRARDARFDTVICMNVLEHLSNFQVSVLRR